MKPCVHRDMLNNQIKLFLINLIGLTLNGCGSSEDAQLNSGSANKSFSIAISTPLLSTPVIPMPSDLPVWAPAFPGAKVSQVIVQGEGGSATKSVVLDTTADVKTVVDYYNSKISAAGLTALMAQDTPDSAVRMVEGISGARDMIMIGRSNSSTSITVAYSVSG